MKLSGHYNRKVGLHFGHSAGVYMMELEEWKILSALCDSAITLLEQDPEATTEPVNENGG